MSQAFTIEFFKSSPAGVVEQILETKEMSFKEEALFRQWAREALAARRCPNYLEQWPEGVRACLAGKEKFRLTA